MSVNNHNAVLDAIAASLTAELPARYVQRGLPTEADLTLAKRLAGLICVVNVGGGQFANYRGREGDLGHMDTTLMGYLQVGESTSPVAIETAELTLLGDLLGWINTTAVPGLDVIYPLEWEQSRQLEHPYGWIGLKLDVKT